MTEPLAPPLGQYLGCGEDVIAAALERCRSEPPGTPRSRLGDTLVAMGVLAHDDLLDALHRQRVDRLRACPHFASLGEETLREIAHHVHEMSVESGVRFITQGEDERCSYVVVAGEVQVFRDGPNGEEVALDRSHPGEMLGEMAHFGETVRTASARAVTRTELLRFDDVDFKRCLALAPQVAVKLLDEVTDRLRRRNVDFQLSVRRRRRAEDSLVGFSELVDLSAAQQLGQGIESVIEQVVSVASRLLGAERATLFLLDAAAQELWALVAEGTEHGELRIPADSGLAGWVLAHGDVVSSADVRRDPRFNAAVDARTGYETKSILCGPVRNMRGEAIGVIEVLNKKDGAFDAADERLFRAFCAQAAVAVENYTLYCRLVNRNRRMNVLLDVATSLTRTLDVRALMREVVAKVAEVLDCERASFFVLDEEAGELWSMPAHGASQDEIRFPVSQGLAGHAARTQEIVNIVDAHEDARFNQRFDAESGYRTTSVLCVPVVDTKGGVLGVVEAINKKDRRRFDGEDEDLLRAVSAQVALALENAQLHSHTAEMRAYLENVQNSITDGILAFAEDLRLVTANRAARRLLGFESEEAIGRSSRELLHSANAHLSDLVSAVVLGGSSLLELDVPLRSSSAGEHAVNANAVPMLDGEGERQGLVLVLEDVTQERRLKGTLTRYMAKDIVEQVLRDPERQALGGVRGKATILLSDVRGFTSLSEKLSAEQTLQFLNEYFSLMVEEIFRERGVLDKFMGDGLMAVFGVPYPRGDDPARAVRSALRMIEALGPFNAHRESRGELPVRVGIGVNSGDVIFGNMGSQKRMEFTVIGDAVNVCSRIEALNKRYGTSILVTGSTACELGDAFTMRLLDRLVVRGRSEPVEIHEVVGEAGTALSVSQELFREGFDAYATGDFETALRSFAKGARSDPACETLRARTEELLRTPPASWDGVWRGEE